jgi:molybdopterin converting factor small subunit
MMSVTVNFPASLSHIAGQSVIVRESVSNIGQLIEALERLAPGMAKELDDPLYNIAVNQEIMLHSVDSRPVKDGDVVEIIPSIAGG